LKYMTAKEEDILTSTNLIQKGIVLDKLMDSLIVTKGVKSSDLLIGDLNAVMVATRILGYGKDYEVGITCPNCGKSVEQTVDLTTLKTQNEPEEDSSHTISVELPISKAVVVLKLLTRGDELDIEKEVKALKKVSSDIDADSTTRLRKMIVSVNGERNAAKIWQFVENLLVKDAKYLREQYKLKVPDVNFTVSINCSCADEIDVRLPIGAKFFWPDA